MILGVAMVLGLSACTSRAGEWTDQTYAIAGGGTTGVYSEYGKHLAEELSDALGIDVIGEETNGSVDNLLRVAEGEALLGFAQGDAAADAVAGVGAFDEPLPVRAVARLYDEYVHVVVRADSAVESIPELAGRVLDAAGMDRSAVRDAQLDLSDSIAAMERGEIDGFFWVGGLPTPGIRELAEQLPVRLLPIELEWVNAVNDRYSDAYRPADFPAGIYGLTESTPTMAVPNYLLAAASTPDAMVRDVLEVLFDARSRMGSEVPAVALLNRRQAIFTAPVELHPGAVDYYRDGRR
jgi:TRAP transporter TAXI family solute receptor